MVTITGQKFDDIINSHLAFNFLEEHCTYINRGSFTRAYDHPQFNNRVVKYNWDVEDGALAFAQYCLTHQSNIHLPIVYAANDCDDHRIIIQEKLYPLSLVNKEVVGAVDELLVMDKKEGIITSTDYSQIYSSADHFLEEVKMCIVGVELTEMHISYIKTVYEMICHFGMYFDIDVNVHNVMQRNDILVIIDPLAQELEYTYDTQDA